MHSFDLELNFTFLFAIATLLIKKEKDNRTTNTIAFTSLAKENNKV